MDSSAATAGVVDMTKTLTKEFAPNINVSAVAPEHASTDTINGLPGTPLERLAGTQDIANAIQFLGNAESGFIAGQQIVVDGGFSFEAGELTPDAIEANQYVRREKNSTVSGWMSAINPL